MPKKNAIAARSRMRKLKGFGEQMQKINYQFEKRRKEMESKARKEEKQRQKAAQKRAAALTPPQKPEDPK